MEHDRQLLLSKIACIAPAALHEVRRKDDGTMTLFRATPDIEQIYGYSADELAQDYGRIWALVHPDDHAEIEAKTEESRRNLSLFECEWRINHPTRGEIWVACRSTPERLPDGSTAWYGYFHDITKNKQTETELQEKERSLSTLLSNLPGVAYRCLCDEHWSMEFVSSGVTALTGYPTHKILSNEISFAELMHPEDQETVRSQTKWAVKHGERFQLEYRITTADGEEKWIWEQGCGVHDPETGELLALEGLLVDITQRKQAEEQLAILSFALDRVQEAAFLVDRQARFLFVNEEACRSLGYSRDELLQMSVKDVAPTMELENARWDDHWQAVKEKGSVRFESTHVRSNGESFPVEVSVSYFDFGGQGYNMGLVRDITLRKQQERDIEYLAYHDGLTALPNRSLVMNRLDQALAQAQEHQHALAVLVVDLDRFKTINETLGHPTGDLLLREVGERLSRILRPEDTVGRLGGDEFLILVPDLDNADDSSHIIERVQACLGPCFDLGERQLHITASIGISLYPRDARTSESLVRFADNALFLAKEEGRNTFRFFSPELDIRIHDRLHIESDLRGAGERGEFFLHYQPQFCLETDAICGVEALVRWRHPSRGLIGPDKFIPIAEDIGLIGQIGDWVLRTACTQAREWHKQGKRVRIAVNVSQRQLEQPDFVTAVATVLQETGCEPTLVELEITESSIMAHPAEAIAKLQALHEMGINLALDDFGTGYSSLNYLKRLPLDRLKVDRSFISGIPEDAHDMAIVQATIVLARQLGLLVVAEGVETVEQRNFLARHGCEEMQGYLLSHPLPMPDIERFLSERHTS